MKARIRGRRSGQPSTRSHESACASFSEFANAMTARSYQRKWNFSREIPIRREDFIGTILHYANDCGDRVGERHEVASGSQRAHLVGPSFARPQLSRFELASRDEWTHAEVVAPDD